MLKQLLVYFFIAILFTSFIPVLIFLYLLSRIGIFIGMLSEKLESEIKETIELIDWEVIK